MCWSNRYEISTEPAVSQLRHYTIFLKDRHKSTHYSIEFVLLFRTEFPLCYSVWPTVAKYKILRVLDTFAKLRKATVSYVMSVCPSVRVGQIVSQWAELHEFWYLSMFRKPAEKIQVSLKSDKNNRYFTWTPIYIFDHISLNSSYIEKCFRQTL